jgi:hypothetical protein
MRLALASAANAVEWLAADDKTDQGTAQDGAAAVSAGERPAGPETPVPGPGDAEGTSASGIVAPQAVAAEPAGGPQTAAGDRGSEPPAVIAEPAGGPQPSAGGRGPEPAAALAGLQPASLPGGSAAAGSPPAASPGREPEGGAEPQPAAHHPPPRGVAMAVWGDDPLIVEVLKDYLSRQLGSEVELVTGSTRAEELFDGEPQPASFLLEARDQGARHVVLATTTFLRERPLYYLGREDVAYQSQVTLESVDATSQQRMTRWSGTVEYTAVQTERALDQAIRVPTAELIEALRR